MKQDIGHKRSKRTAKPGFKDNGAFKRNKRSRKEQQRKANSLLSFLGAKIREIREGRKVSSAYSPAASLSPPSYFIDQKK